tara:strand:- start:2569 stop:2844 length:276 start_codon:yes stop_codon:yes gene_type:complete
MNTEQFDGHTLGHWAITTRKGTWVVHTQDNGDVATMNDYEDAKLIRAAPDLLDALIHEREENERLTEKVRMLNSRCMHLEGLLEEWTEGSE